MAGIGSSGVGCTITVSPPAIAMAEASGTAVADRCRASLDRARNRGSVTTAGTDAWRPEIAARTRPGAQARSRTAEAGTGRTACPHRRRTSERRRTAGGDRRRTARPHRRRTRELRKYRSRRQRNSCERHGQLQDCRPGHHGFLRSRFASRGQAPARSARKSSSTNGCRAPGRPSHALAGHRRVRGGSGTTPHRAPAGTRASAACRR
jgi:hypothetical protein